MLDSGVDAIYFPSPVPPDEEPPYIPEQHETKPEEDKDKGHVSNPYLFIFFKFFSNLLGIHSFRLAMLAVTQPPM